MKRLLALLVLTWLAAAGARAGEVIAHPSVHLSGDDVRNVFLGEKLLAGNVKLVPVDNIVQQAAFLAKVLQTDERKYLARWIRKSFREGLAAPPVKGSDSEVIAFVRATPGAVGYVSELGTGDAGVKVLERY